jgi:prepilin-type processing-associated H-X9-DG protein
MRPIISRAFTLVELVVVVGVIGLLVALLLPAMGRARAQAQRLKCASNLRSIGQAMTSYVQQFGYYPVYRLNDSSTTLLNIAIWPAQLRLFMGGGEETFYCPAQDERCNWWRPGADPPPGHPGDRAAGFHTNFGYRPGELLLSSEGFYFSYGYNFQGALGSTPLNAWGRGLGSVCFAQNQAGSGGSGPTKASRVKDASEMIAVADSNADAVWDTAISPLPTLGMMRACPGRVHNGGANVLFCDGHVAWYPQEDLVLSPDLISAKDLEKRRMWNFDHEP